MSSHTRNMLFIALFAVVGFAVLAIISAKLYVPSPPQAYGQVSTVVAGRSVVGVTIRGGTPVGVSGGNEAATVHIGTLAVKVTAAEVTLPDGRTVTIPAECQRVEIWEDTKGVRILFDGVEAK